MQTIAPLPPCPDYFPLAHGRYDVTAGLKALGEKTPFELDPNYLEYLLAKQAARRENPAKYFVEADFSPELQRAIARYALDALARFHPAAFAVARDGECARFHNRLIGLSALLDFSSLCVQNIERTPALLPGGEAIYADFDLIGCGLFDFLALQTQEDWAVDQVDPASGREWLSAIHLSFPNHWSPADKIGRHFAAVHKPVAGIEPLLKAAPSLIDMMINKGPWERFAWGVSTDTRLNHHPDNVEDPAHRAKSTELETGTPDEVGQGTYLRIERQVLKGFPDASGALFLIRTYFRPVSEIARDPARAQALASAIRGMKPESVVYKGLTCLRTPLVAYLDAACKL